MKCFFGIDLVVVFGLIAHVRCHSAKTLELVETIKTILDRTKDPCTDFFGYACGNWDKAQDPEHVANYVDAIGSLNYFMTKADEEILEKISAKMQTNGGQGDEIYQKMSDFYETCKSPRQGRSLMEGSLEILKADEHLSVVVNVLEALANSQPSVGARPQWDRYAALGKLHRYNARDLPFVEGRKMLNGTAAIVKILVPESWPSYYDFGTFGNYDSDYKEVKDAEKLYNKLKSLARRLDASSKQEKDVTLSELRAHVPRFGWDAYFDALLNFPLGDDALIHVNSLEYLSSIDELLYEASPTIVANLWAAMLERHLSNVLPQNANDGFSCAEFMRKNLKLAMNYLYEMDNYGAKRRTKDASINRIFSIMQGKFFHFLLEHESYFSPEQMEYLKEKITHMRLNIGNILRNVDRQHYFDYYKDFRPTPYSLEGNILQVLQLSTTLEHEALHWQLFSPQFEVTEFDGESPSFECETNTMTIPFGYLIEPYFHEDYDELFLFAEIGNSVGHEIIHGFDLKGIHRDRFGNYRDLMEESIKSDPHILQSLKCLQRERTRMLNEKIADFSGFRLAYESYFDPEHPREFNGDSEFSDKQFFFIKLAQFFCAKQSVRYDSSHDTPYDRVPLIAKNNLDFYEAFNCPKDMQQEVCNLW